MKRKQKGLDGGIDRNKLKGASDLESEIVCSLDMGVRCDFVESEDQVGDLCTRTGRGRGFTSGRGS